MHDSVYAGQFEWSTFANGRDMNAPKIFKRYAKSIGVDTKAFATCLDSRQFDGQIKANQNYGISLGVSGTPTFVIGKRMTSRLSYDVIKALVDSALADAKDSVVKRGAKSGN
jgi:protein-disulfide isomerase